MAMAKEDLLEEVAASEELAVKNAEQINDLCLRHQGDDFVVGDLRPLRADIDQADACGSPTQAIRWLPRPTGLRPAERRAQSLCKLSRACGRIVSVGEMRIVSQVERHFVHLAGQQDDVR